MQLGDLKRVPIKIEIIRACLFKYRFMTSTGNSCYCMYVQWLKKPRGWDGGVQFRVYHLINTSHDVTESRNKQDIVQIRPLVRHNL